MSDSEIMTAKIALRKQITLVLKKLGKDEKIRQSKKITQKVLNNEKFHQAKSISIYLNMDDEVQTEELLMEVFKQGKKCFIPRNNPNAYLWAYPLPVIWTDINKKYSQVSCLFRHTRRVKHDIKYHATPVLDIFKFGNPEMEMIRLPTLEDYHKLPKNKWNIKQPPDDQNMESVFDKRELDLVLTPGLGFTLNGDRLGRGKGYYDRFFEKCQKEMKSFPYLIGLAYNEQIQPEIPTSEFDVRLDLVYSADP